MHNNDGTSARSVKCPIFQTGDVSTPNANRNVFVRVYDRSPGTKLTCRVTLYDTTGHEVAFLAQSTATGFFSAAPTTLSFVFPSIGTATTIGMVDCSIPGFDSVNGLSHIVGIDWNSNTF